MLGAIIISSCKKEDLGSDCNTTDYNIFNNTFILYQLNWNGEIINGPYCGNCMEVNATFDDDEYEIYYNIWRTNELNEIDTINYIETGTYSYTFCNRSPGRYSGMTTVGNIKFNPSNSVEYSSSYIYHGSTGLSIDNLKIDSESHFVTLWPL